MAEQYELIIIPLNNDIALDYDYLVKVDDLQSRFESAFKQEFEMSKSQALFNLGFNSKKQKMSFSLKYIYHICKYFLHQLVLIPDLDELRDKIIVNLSDENIEYFLRITPGMVNSQYINQQWIRLIWKLINQGYQEVAQGINDSIQDFLYKKNRSFLNAGKVVFHLAENKLDPTLFAFMVTYQTYDISTARIKNSSLKNTLELHNDDQEQLVKILGPISNVAGNSNFINQLLESGEIFYPLSLTKDEAVIFLNEIPLYEKANIICKVPNWWKKKYKSTIKVQIGNNKSYLNFSELADFQVDIVLGNLNISLHELDEILKEENDLVRYKGEWIQIDQERLLELKAAYLKVCNQLNNEGLTLFDALKLQLNKTKIAGADEEIEIEVSKGEWIEKTLLKLVENEGLSDVKLGDDFQSTLRPYQKKGMKWLNAMQDLHLGCCLADDMGLGKTVQVLAWLNARKSQKLNNLLVIPASLVGNWISEINRFTPRLKYYLMHPSYQVDKAILNDIADINEYDLVITTYSMLPKIKLIKEVEWDNVILDEAQAIKNPTTLQSKNAKALKSKHRIALTGTPIENRLSDLWSLFDFLNKGLLGSSKEFKEYVKAMDEDETYYERLKQQIAPFILRRLKTDKLIISDLPDKIENKVYAILSKRQLALYNDTLETLKENIESSEGIGRKGLILQSIIKFKQICNHPAQYLGEDDYLAEDSGKFELLKELCMNIASLRERVLVFTQFKEITTYLDDYLADIFGKRGLTLTGSTQIKKRKELVDLFQSDQYIPYMIITVKAGGVGLNLTNANHVIHFDRWWNPAVENQATDRAFRIGQVKNVMVYKFITKNTVEEKIDDMIMDKVKVAEALIGDNSEAIIMNMSNQEIIDLFKLER